MEVINNTGMFLPSKNLKSNREKGKYAGNYNKALCVKWHESCECCGSEGQEDGASPRAQGRAPPREEVLLTRPACQHGSGLCNDVGETFFLYKIGL